MSQAVLPDWRALLRRGVVRTLAVLTVSTGWSCTSEPQPAGDTADPTTSCGGASIEIGTGAYEFETLSEGDGVTMVHGPQGGWHILGSIRAIGTTQIVTIHFTVTANDGESIVADNKYTVQLVAVDECTGYYPGMYGYLDVTELADGGLDTPPELLSYEPLLMTMTLEDQEGTELADTIDVVALPDPADVDTGLDER